MKFKELALFCCDPQNWHVSYIYEPKISCFELRDVINNKNFTLKKYNYSKNKPYISTTSSVKGNYIYFLFKNNSMVYCGVTCSLRNRIRTHKVDKKFNKVYFIYFNEKITRTYVESLEYLIIKKTQPKYNNKFKLN